MTSNSNSSSHELTVADLQLMLRGKKRRVLSTSGLAPLLSAGENFACSLYKIEARVILVEDEENHGNEKEKELQLVAKLFPSDEYIIGLFDFRQLFRKEIFLYDKLVPAFQQLDKNGLTFELTPELYGVRYSKNRSGSEEVDDGAVILLDNLKCKGYYTGDKTEGLDLEHSRAAILALSRFHGYGLACKQLRPDFFHGEVLPQMQPVPYKSDEKLNVLQFLLDMMFTDARLAAHRERISGYLTADVKRQQLYCSGAASNNQEPWLGLAHFDFWTNNVLFRKDEEGKVADVRFIDFQNYSYASPLRDLPYFLCTSTAKDVMTQHFRELLDLYYESLIETLERLGCDTTAFTRQTFEAQLKLDAAHEFFHDVIAIKFFCAEVDKETYEPSQLNKVVIQSQINALGFDKWHQLVLTYIEQGWL